MSARTTASTNHSAAQANSSPFSISGPSQIGRQLQIDAQRRGALALAPKAFFVYSRAQASQA